MVEEIGIAEQHRSTPTFPDNFGSDSFADPEIHHICEKALEDDALSALAWYNLGQCRHNEGDDNSAAICFLFSAIIVPNDLEAWGNVVALAWNLQDWNLYVHTVITCHQIHGDEALQNFVRQVPEEHRDQLISLWSEAISLSNEIATDDTSGSKNEKTLQYEFSINPDGELKQN